MTWTGSVHVKKIRLLDSGNKPIQYKLVTYNNHTKDSSSKQHSGVQTSRDSSMQTELKQIYCTHNFQLDDLIDFDDFELCNYFSA